MSVDIRFVLIPFLPRQLPALGVSSLTSVLKAAGRSADVAYYNLRILKQIPPGLYDRIAQTPVTSLLGEVLFAKALWGEAAPRWEDYLTEFLRRLQASRVDMLITTKAYLSRQDHERYLRSLHE